MQVLIGEKMVDMIGVALPFPEKNGNAVTIPQGWDGFYSHRNIDRFTNLTFSIDFATPYESFVSPIPPEEVVRMRMGSDKYYEGYKPKIGNGLALAKETNVIKVKHPYHGNVVSTYSHLKKDSQLVQIGDWVEPRDEIAKTGKSGWVANVPHLHIHLNKGGEIKTVSIPFYLPGRLLDYGKSVR